jgi:hypothetical protein
MSHVPLRVQELLGGLVGANLEKYSEFTKISKGEFEIFFISPRTCIVTKKPHINENIKLYPNMSIAMFNMLRTEEIELGY